MPIWPGLVSGRGGGLEGDEDGDVVGARWGREAASHWRKVGNMGGFAKGRSMALGLWEPEKG